MSQFPPPRWSTEEFEADASQAIAIFREARMQEPLDQYLELFDRHRSAVEDLIEGTVDLSRLREFAVDYLSDPDLQMAVRYLSGPPVSVDDLKTTAEALLSPTRLRADHEMARRVIDTVMLGLDRHRFPWMGEDREPTEAERQTAIISTTALITAQRLQTRRRNESKDVQEQAVADCLIAEGFVQVPTRAIPTLDKAPGAGEFCRETSFGTRKADLVVGLWDGRKMPIECKVSNSSTNSIKRLNGDAAIKAKTWIGEFGTQGVVPTAMLGGVFKVRNLESAQNLGLTIFWAHAMDALVEFIEATRP